MWFSKILLRQLFCLHIRKDPLSFLILVPCSLSSRKCSATKYWNCRKTLQINVTTFSAGIFVERSLFFSSDSLWDIPVAYSSWMSSSQLRCSFVLHIPFLFFVLGNSSCSCSLHRVLLWENSSCILKSIRNSKQAKKCFSSLSYYRFPEL